MNLGIRVHDIKQAPFENRIRYIKEQGFTCGHLALSKTISEFSTANQALTPGLAMYIRDIFRKNEVDIAVLGCYLNLANPDEEELRKIKDTYKAHIRFAKHLGCGVVGTETGAPNREYAYVPECHSEEALALFIRNLKEIVDYAEKMGVIVAIEPVYKHIVWNAQCARRVLDEIHSPNLQIIFDPVNLLSESNYHNYHDIIKEAVELLGDDIAVIHIKDFKVIDGRLQAVGAGLGEMDYEFLLKYIKENKPYIHATLENTVPENAQQCRKKLMSIYETL